MMSVHEPEANTGTDLRHYRLFDVLLACDLDLPGMPCAEPGIAGISVRRQAASGSASWQPEWFHEWRDGSGAVTMAAARHEGAYLLHFPDCADYLIAASLDAISVRAEPRATAETLAHLLVDQVLPRVMNQRGRLVAHASAVILPGNQAVAFLGNTGRGKSTLASAFHRAGCRVLADDCLLLEEGDGGVLATPAYPGLRLWSDSVEALFPDHAGFRPMSHYSDKRKLNLTPEASGPVGTRLRALFLLEAPSADTDPGAIRISAAEGASVAISLLDSVFALDPVLPERVEHNFRLVGSLLQSGLPVFRLAFPRDYARLDGVCAAVAQAVAELQPSAGAAEAVSLRA